MWQFFLNVQNNFFFLKYVLKVSANKKLRTNEYEIYEHYLIQSYAR